MAAKPLDLEANLIEEAEAGLAWMSGAFGVRRIALPAVGAIVGVALVYFANAAARQGTPGMAPLWWAGVLAIFMPTAALLVFGRASRNEAVTALLLVGVALYCVKLLYAPGMLWEFDELLHYRTLDDVLRTGHVFNNNPLLHVSPYYPGLESVIASIKLVTGLSEIQAGLVLVAIVRLLGVLAIFLLLERVAIPSRFAGPATLLYMTCPAFLYFDAMMSYESMALALALVTLFVLAAAQLEQGAQRQRLNVVGAVLVLAVVVTHHVTSFILAGALTAWVLFQLFYTSRARKRDDAAPLAGTRRQQLIARVSDLPGSLWVPVLAVAATALWLLNVAEVAISYLLPQLVDGVTEMLRMIFSHESGRQLFQSSGGHSSPLLERLAGLGSVALILLLIPISLKYIWERRHSNVLAQFFAIGSLGYPAILALRFTRNGWDVGSRATAFVYLPLAFTIAAGLELLITRRFKDSRAFAVIAMAAVAIIFAGGIIAGTAPITRMPSPYDPGVAEVPYDVESIAAADWAASTFGPGHRMVADSAQATLMGSVGRQHVLSSEESVSVSAIYIEPGLDVWGREIISNNSIGYVLVDRRLAGVEPLKGFLFEKWEREIFDYGSSLSTSTVGKFDEVRAADRVFDSGNLQFMGVGRLATHE